MAEIIDGVNIRMGGKTFYVPPLNFKRVRALREKLVAISTIKEVVPTDVQMKLIAECVHSAVERNYPDMSFKELEDLLDLGNVPIVLKAIMGASGYEERQAGETQAT